MAYLMGLYDGDGNARNPSISSGSKAMLYDLKKRYRLQTNITFYKNKLGQCYSLGLTSNFMKILLSNYPNSMKRKRLGLIDKIDSKDLCGVCLSSLKWKESNSCKKCCLKRKKSSFIKTKDDLAIFKKMLNSDNMTKIGKYFNVSGNAVRKYLKNHNIKSPFSFDQKKKKFKEIIKLNESGIKTEKISKLYKISEDRVRQIIREYKKENNLYFYKPRKYDYKLVYKTFFQYNDYSKTGRYLNIPRASVRYIVLKMQK